MEWNGVKWSGVERSGVEWNAAKWDGVEWSAPEPGEASERRFSKFGGWPETELFLIQIP